MSHYNLFYTDMPIPAGTKPDLTLVVPIKFMTEDEALLQAFKLIHSSAIAWKIEGPEGFHLDREDIERAYWKFKTS